MSNFSEEEKKAIESLRKNRGVSFAQADIISNLIDKQQKEIEELNEIKQQICNEELITQDYVQENFIKKDKIKEKIRQREHIIHNSKLEYGKDYEMYEDTHLAREEIALYRELLEE